MISILPNILILRSLNFIDLVSDEFCGLIPVKHILDVDKMTDYYKCVKTFLEDRGKEKYFDCLCELDALTQIFGIDIPCCKKDCGRKY